MKYLEKLEQEVSSWPQVTGHPHRFGGRGFSFGSAEIGHIHTGEIVDIPFPRSVRDVLLVDRLAEEHHWVPNSGLDHLPYSYRTGSQACLLAHATILFALLLKTSTDPRKLLEQESEKLTLNPQFKSLFEPFVSKVAVEPLRA